MNRPKTTRAREAALPADFHSQLLTTADIVGLLVTYFRFKRPVLIVTPEARAEAFLPPCDSVGLAGAPVLKIGLPRSKRAVSHLKRLSALKKATFDAIFIDPRLCSHPLEERLQDLGVPLLRIFPLRDVDDIQIVLNEHNQWDLGLYQLGVKFFQAQDYPKSKLWFERFVSSQTSSRRVPPPAFARYARQCMARLPQLLHSYAQRPQKIKVSVIMAAWNRALVIERAIRSVLRQKYRNFELIVVDDGSSDGTDAVVRRLCATDERVRLVGTPHVGVSHARNTGLKAASGDLIAYLDSDNEWQEEYLLFMVNLFVDHPRTATGYCAIHVADTVNNRNYIRFNAYDRKRLLHLNFIDLNIFMHRRFLWEKLGGFNEGLTRLVDWELILKYTDKYPPFFINSVMAKYHLDRKLKNITHTVGLEKNLKKVQELHPG
jgi:hypothetical protein